MTNRTLVLSSALVLAFVAIGAAQAPTGPRPPTAQEITSAKDEIPALAKVLDLQPGMTAADVGAGFGAMTWELSKWLGPSGRMFATELGREQLESLRSLVAREHLDTVTVIEGGAAATNLPEGCCDAIYLHDVYHHIAQPEVIDRGLAAALKPGGRLAIIDFEPRPGSTTPEGLGPNRVGHGISPATVQSEFTAAGLTHVRTIAKWPPEAKSDRLFLVLFKKAAG